MNPSIQPADPNEEIATLKIALAEKSEEIKRLRDPMANEKVKELISDKLLDEVWGNANFGSPSKREVVRNSLLKCASGYYTGRTAKMILIELGLVCRAKWQLTKLGKEYLFAAYSNGNSI